MAILQRRKVNPDSDPPAAFVAPSLIDSFRAEIMAEVLKLRSTDGQGVVVTFIHHVIDTTMRYLRKTDDPEIKEQVGKLAWAAIVSAKANGITFHAFGLGE